MIKKYLKRAASFILACALMFTLTACSMPLRGTYTAKDSVIEQSFTFVDDKTVEVSAFGINVKGEYEIKNGEITVTYSLFNLSYDWVKSFKRDGNSIFVDGTEFVKEN